MYKAGHTLALLTYLPAGTLVLTSRQDYADLYNARLAELGRDDITIDVVKPGAPGLAITSVVYDVLDISPATGMEATND